MKRDRTLDDERDRLSVAVNMLYRARRKENRFKKYIAEQPFDEIFGDASLLAHPAFEVGRVA